MRRREGRHPFFENLVFGLALLLGLILGFYALRALIAGGLGLGSKRGVVDVPERHGLKSSGTGDAVGSVPRLKRR